MTADERQKATDARREYHRRWREKNKDRVRQYNAQYWLRKAQEVEREGKQSV